MPASPPPSIGTMYGGVPPDTFLGLPPATLPEAAGVHVALFGAATATPYPSVGAYCAGAPQAIRAAMAGRAATLTHMDFDFDDHLLPDGVTAVDCGDLPIDPDDTSGNRAKITAAARSLLDGGAVPILIGGDDSVPIPLFDAFEGRGAFTILQIDAHIDWRDEVQGIRFGLSSPMRRASEMPWIERMVQVGARGTGSARVSDYQDACAAGVSFVTAREVAAHGIHAAVEAISPGANLIITLDCDGLDPSIIPGVLGPAPGGLTYWQTVELLHGAAQRARIAAFDIVEYVPDRDIQSQGALVAGRLVANVIGLIARQQPRQ
ncbi:MAG: arginase family protein [Acetobacteraceae bacterium]|nr:arginase family protein [Acetobacteraceae bacterium]